MGNQIKKGKEERIGEKNKNKSHISPSQERDGGLKKGGEPVVGTGVVAGTGVDGEEESPAGASR
jgi:hypothetical protein